MDSIYSLLPERHPQSVKKKSCRRLFEFSDSCSVKAGGDSAHAQIELLALYLRKLTLYFLFRFSCDFSFTSFGGNHITNRFHFLTSDPFGLPYE